MCLLVLVEIGGGGRDRAWSGSNGFSIILCMYKIGQIFGYVNEVNGRMPNYVRFESSSMFVEFISVCSCCHSEILLYR